MLKEHIRKYVFSDLSKFFLANAFYSFSTWLIGYVSPYVLTSSCYQEFIYVFQSIMYMTSVFTLGLTPALLRYYKYDKVRFKSYFIVTIGLIYLLLLLLGFWKFNPLSEFLHVSQYSFKEHVIIYISVIMNLMYVFNRALLTAEENYNKLVCSIGLIVLTRFVGLILLKFFDINSLTLVLLIVCILPMIYEAYIYWSTWGKVKRTSWESYSAFIRFALITSLIGVIYTTTGRLFLLEVKSGSDSLAAVVSYSYSMVGIITIFNTTFSSFFIGKLDSRTPDNVHAYLIKIRKAFPIFLFLTALVTSCLFVFVKFTYPYASIVAASYTAVSVLSTAIIAYIGLVTLLAKTYNILNLQLLINVVCLLIVLFVVKSPINKDFVKFIFVNIIQISCECFLALLVLKRVNRQN